MRKQKFTGHIYLTQAQYDRLKSENKLVAGSIYHITDIEYLDKKDIDAQISDTSENPVQNKVIAEALKDAKDYNNLINKPTLNGKALEGEVTLSKADLGLGSVDNTSDADKPVSTEQRAAIDQALEDAKTYTNEQLATVSVDKFTNDKLGTIKGSTADGFVNANDDGTGSVNGWQAVIDRLDNLEYKPMAITSFSVTPGPVFEIGSTVDSLTFSWAFNKTPKTVTLNNEAVDNTLTGKELTGLGLKTNTSYTLVAEDNKGGSATKVVSVSFLHGVYYGAAAAVAESADILNLTKRLQSNKVITFTANAGVSQYLWYCLPTAYGTPEFDVGGFKGGFKKVATIDFTNASGNVTQYDIWKSDNTNLGNTTVKVS